MMISGMFAFHTVVNLVATAFFICSRLKLVPPTATRQDQTYGWKFQLEIPMAIKINLIFSFYIQVKVSCSCERAKWECCGSWRIPYCKNPNQHCNALDCHRWCFNYTLFIINPCITVLISFTSTNVLSPSSGVSAFRWHGWEKDALEPGESLFTRSSKSQSAIKFTPELSSPWISLPGSSGAQSSRNAGIPELSGRNLKSPLL